MGLLVAAVLALVAAPPAAPGRTVRVVATAYCQPGKTQSGTKARTGIVAADPTVIPVGSVVRVLDGAASGIYTVMDTGAQIKGQKIDIFIPDCARAKHFGEQRLRIRILRHGWNPKASAGDQ
jgi:3D (Asp-Asp-Asp) domain-containing protein